MQLLIKQVMMNVLNNQTKCFQFKSIHANKKTVIKIDSYTRPKLCGNCTFPQNFHTMKLGEITVFYAVIHDIFKQKFPLSLIRFSSLMKITSISYR